MITCECRPANRFEIEKKLREAKRVENRRQKVAQTASASVSQRSKDRRKVVEDKKDNKKVSALQDLKARREEKKKQGKRAPVVFIALVILHSIVFLVVFIFCLNSLPFLQL